MPSTERVIASLTRRLLALAALLLVSGLTANSAAAVDCNAVLNAQVPDFASDSDKDGFTDYQECSGITLAFGPLVPSCVVASGSPPPERSTCMHPDSLDLFVIYAPAAQGSLLVGGDPRTEIREPFKTVSAYGLTFLGLGALGVTIHQVSPQEVNEDRTVTALQLEPPNPLLSAQKAVKVTEDLDTSGATLGYCQYGTPNGLGGCAIFTQRIMNFINSTCVGLNIVQSDGTVSDAQSVFKAYTTHTILHEVGHTIGGLTSSYNSRYGGYHYSSGTIMEQYVVVTTKKGCKFAIGKDWNMSLDPTAVRLK